jgi:hypothetical protein
MGSAMDAGTNELLTSRSLESAIKAFDKAFMTGFINNKRVNYQDSELIVYAEKDFDAELLQPEDLEQISVEKYKELVQKKKDSGFENLSLEEKKYYNLCNHLCLRRKGHLMLKAYHDDILPNIKEVLAVQKKIVIKNSEGDEVVAYIDAEIVWKDGKRYVIDNKTSTWEYEEDSASKSQQLISYYHFEKIPMKLDGAGFFVMYKQIDKNRIKICSKCGKDGSGARHKTCDAEIESTFSKKDTPVNVMDIKYTRCHGSWNETIHPKCRTQVILNDIKPAAENLVIETFDEANEGIKKGAFGPNLDACHKFGMPCQFYKKCWEGKDDELIQLEEKKDERN